MNEKIKHLEKFIGSNFFLVKLKNGKEKVLEVSLLSKILNILKKLNSLKTENLI
jgi:hypothetical protein